MTNNYRAQCSKVIYARMVCNATLEYVVHAIAYSVRSLKSVVIHPSQ